MILSSFIVIVVLGVALVHALWGFGVWVPIRNEEALAKAVVGARGVTRMPGPIPCFLVAGGLSLLAAAVLFLPQGSLRTVLFIGATAVFLARGALAYLKKWRLMTPEEPFATLDRRIYGPLCVALGIAFIILNLGS